ncbi:MAG TPA: hypothetical protein VGC80_07720 [Acetobacteraceae bacterium]
MLVFAYTVENPGPGDLYVMDATPSIDPATRQPKADDQAAVVMLGPGDDAIIGKFIAPLPATRRVAMPVIPLAVRLLPGAMLDRRLEVPLPLAEISPYFADLPLRRYQPVDIKGVRFTIGYWDANAEGVAAAPAAFAPGLVAVVTRAPMRAATCTQRFPTTGLQLFKRTDDFPRLAE